MLLENIYDNLKENSELSVEELCNYLERKSRILSTTPEWINDPIQEPIRYLHYVIDNLDTDKKGTDHEWSLITRNVEEAYQQIKGIDLDKSKLFYQNDYQIKRDERNSKDYISQIAKDLRGKEICFSNEQLIEMRTELKRSYQLAKQEVKSDEEKKELLSTYRSALALNQNNIKESHEIQGKKLSDILLDCDLSIHRKIKLADKWIDYNKTHGMISDNYKNSLGINIQLDAFEELLEDEEIKLRKKERSNYHNLQNKIEELTDRLERPQQYFDNLYNNIIDLIPNVETEEVVSLSGLSDGNNLNNTEIGLIKFDEIEETNSFDQKSYEENLLANNLGYKYVESEELASLSNRVLAKLYSISNGAAESKDLVKLIKKEKNSFEEKDTIIKDIEEFVLFNKDQLPSYDQKIMLGLVSYFSQDQKISSTENDPNLYLHSIISNYIDCDKSTIIKHDETIFGEKVPKTRFKKDTNSSFINRSLKRLKKPILATATALGLGLALLPGYNPVIEPIMVSETSTEYNDNNVSVLEDEIDSPINYTPFDLESSINQGAENESTDNTTEQIASIQGSVDNNLVSSGTVVELNEDIYDSIPDQLIDSENQSNIVTLINDGFNFGDGRIIPNADTYEHSRHGTPNDGVLTNQEIINQVYRFANNNDTNPWRTANRLGISMNGLINQGRSRIATTESLASIITTSTRDPDSFIADSNDSDSIYEDL